jgi:hypothetical protein
VTVLVFRCSSCQTLHEAGDGLAGKKVRCQNCRAWNVVAAPGRPRPKKARPPWWVVIAWYAAPLVFIVACCGLIQGLGYGFRFDAAAVRPDARASFLKVHVGMTAADVRLLMGEPDRKDEVGGARLWTYRNNGDQFVIILDGEGIVANKTFSGR